MQEIAFQQQAAVFKALSHPARLQMVDAMREGSQCVCELRDVVGLDMSTVSKHLSVLKHAGVVFGEKKGTWVHYSLRTPCVLQFMDCLTAMFEQKEPGS